MVQALIFDVFGTCVDWRNSVARAVRKALPEVEPEEFAVAWRAEYDPAMARIRDGGRGYVPLEQLHLENLNLVSERVGVTAPDSLNAVWEALDPWPDVVPGLKKIKKTHIIAPCSNGSIAMMTRLARYGGLPWDCILGAEIARDYKPKPAVYHAACNALGLPVDQVMMVAAHNADLDAARGCGLRTAFVPRRTEHGPAQTKDLRAESDWDVVADDFEDLAGKL